MAENGLDMWNMITEAYGRSARIAVALPLLFLLPMAAELIQHVIEYRIGMFASMASMQAAGDNAARMGFGQVKILSLMLLIYWVSRTMAFGGDRTERVLGDRKSAVLFAGVILLGFALALVQQFGGGVIAPYVPSAGMLLGIGVAVYVLAAVLDIYLTPWKVGAALGNERLTIPASFRIMHGNFWWSFGFSLAMAIPIIVAHYVLNTVPIGRPAAIQWPVLVVDALLVGYLGILLAVTAFLIARRAAERKGVALR